MNENPILLLRQKILLGLSIVTGFSLLISYKYRLMDPVSLEGFILFYSIGVPMFLLVFDTLTDLNDNRVFLIWLLIALILFAFYLLPKISAYAYLTEVSTAPLKSLLVFLLLYKLLNAFMKRSTGNFLINTHWQASMDHESQDRRINWLDICFNILLYAAIVISVLTK